MAAFCKLADPNQYVACAMDLAASHVQRRAYVDFFKRHLEVLLDMGCDVEREKGKSATEFECAASACRKQFHEIFDEFAQNPAKRGRLTILMMARRRDECLREYGFDDPFAALKRRENQRALELLPTVCRELDCLDEPSQLRAIVEGVFAGNIFDMGAEATAQTFRDAGPDFFQTRKQLPPRPWLIDDYDQLADRMLRGQRHRKAIFFIDNAGSDFMLGALPMIRWLARRGTRVVIAANETPTLNDMTANDVREWWATIVATESSIASLPIEVVSSGTGEPLIDLLEISDALNAAARDADFVILEGMGRGVESNLDARFTCDALNIAMIKDEAVAKSIGGKLFDLVCRFR